MLPLFPKWLRHCLLCIGWWGVFGFLAKLGSNEASPSNLQVLFTVGMAPWMAPLILVVLVRSRLRVETDRRGMVCLTESPLLTICLAGLFLSEQPTALQWMGILLAILAAGVPVQAHTRKGRGML
jgi:uncharacterized membrane protein